MNAFPAWASFVLLFGIIFTSGLAARWLPLTEGWTIIVAGAIAGASGFLVDRWGKRRASRS